MTIRHGDFTEMARHYVHRPAYSADVLRMILALCDAPTKKDFKVADVGAGTGKLTKMLLELGLNVVAVEPNDAMRAEGIKYTEAHAVTWKKGFGEDTGLDAASVDWVVMGSSFHWTDPERSLAEYHRVLKPGGRFTAIWNPRDIGRSEWHQRIEGLVFDVLPGMKRVSSGAQNAKPWGEIIAATGHFTNVVYVEAPYEEEVTPERYLGAWRSVNDIRVQAGEEKFNLILQRIAAEVAALQTIVVPYKIRAWTAEKRSA